MSDFITQVAGRIGELEREGDQLRELNDCLIRTNGELRELNAELWEIIRLLLTSMVEHDKAKAEKLK
jgi:hypothetical protein